MGGYAHLMHLEVCSPVFHLACYIHVSVVYIYMYVNCIHVYFVYMFLLQLQASAISTHCGPTAREV